MPAREPNMVDTLRQYGRILRLLAAVRKVYHETDPVRSSIQHDADIETCSECDSFMKAVQDQIK